jgi:hypothetical protein
MNKTPGQGIRTSTSLSSLFKSRPNQTAAQTLPQKGEILEAEMADKDTKSKSGEQKTGSGANIERRANLGQKEAKAEKKSEDLLHHMGEKSPQSKKGGQPMAGQSPSQTTRKD